MCENQNVSYPAALIDNPAGKTVLEVVERHLLDLPCHGSAHAGHLNGRLSEPEHASNCLPASIATDVVTHQLLKPTHIAVASVLHQLSDDRRGNSLDRLLDKTPFSILHHMLGKNDTDMTVSQYLTMP